MVNGCWAATMDSEGATIGWADRGVAGWTPLRERIAFASWDAASAEADARNEAMGIDRHESTEIVISSMRAQNLAVR